MKAAQLQYEIRQLCFAQEDCNKNEEQTMSVTDLPEKVKP
jgi:hypothetical protein